MMEFWEQDKLSALAFYLSFHLFSIYPFLRKLKKHENTF